MPARRTDPRQRRFPIIGIRERNAKRDDTITFRVPEDFGCCLHDRARSVGISRSKLCYTILAEYIERQIGTRTPRVHDPAITAQIEHGLYDAIDLIMAALGNVARLKRTA